MTRDLKASGEKQTRKPHDTRKTDLFKPALFIVEQQLIRKSQKKVTPPFHFPKKNRKIKEFALPGRFSFILGIDFLR